MTEPTTDLSGGFPKIGYLEWRSGIEAALRGRDFEQTLRSFDPDGIAYGPLHARGDDVSPDAGLMSAFRRSLRACLPEAPVAIEIRQAQDHPDPAVANERLLEDLAQGATAIALRIDPEGRNGIAIRGLGDLDRTLEAVDQTLAPVHLAAGRFGPRIAALMMALWDRGGVMAPRGGFGIDPLGTLLSEGRLMTSLSDAMREAAEIGAQTAQRWPDMTALSVSGARFHDMGATASQELALTLASALAGLRAMTGVGLSPDSAARQIAFSLAVDMDLFMGIAKLRAMRVLWARVVTACGGAMPRMHLCAESSGRMMTRHAAETNMLRTTAAAMAARLGCADAVTLAPWYRGEEEPLVRKARRIARSQPILFDEESHAGHVLDPAGGSFALESLSVALAEKAWNIFRRIEAEGGMAEAIAAGSIHLMLKSSAKRLMERAKAGEIPLIGVSVYPDPEGARHSMDEAKAMDRPAGGETQEGPVAAPDAAMTTAIPVIRLAAPFEESKA